MGRGSIDHLMEIGWIKPSGRKNIPGKPALWVTTELFMEHFGLEKISDLPNKSLIRSLLSIVNININIILYIK